MAPARTCVGCRTTADRGDLLRLVRSPNGARVDPQGSAPGRGAYVHRLTGCVREAVRKGTLARALRTGLGPEELGRLQAEIKQQMGAS
jgi:predicted RNA-binding protein YlxR (DUF448 family)